MRLLSLTSPLWLGTSPIFHIFHYICILHSYPDVFLLHIAISQLSFSIGSKKHLPLNPSFGKVPESSLVIPSIPIPLKPPYTVVKTMVSRRFSRKSMHWSKQVHLWHGLLLNGSANPSPFVVNQLVHFLIPLLPQLFLQLTKSSWLYHQLLTWAPAACVIHGTALTPKIDLLRRQATQLLLATIAVGLTTQQEWFASSYTIMNPYVCMYVCLSVCLSVCVCMSECTYIYIYI